ncbi:MAG TPA: HAD family phosphatase [Pyrinomonadaceae bacterium]|jgi:HAD superfamily hydrolase (TIGR01509 family)|nr:HAD family phosphatase [Pyrinomonadaceae bacterium]
MIQAILFDFNGVVIDDEPLHKKAYQDALAAEDISISDSEYYDSLGMDDVTFVRAAFERAGRDLSDETLRAVIKRESELHRAMIDGELPLFPGVVTFIKSLARVYPLGVVSMARRDQIDYVLERASLNKLFDVVVSAEDVRACKPDPGCYKRALELLNEKRSAAHAPPFQPSECLVIEDSPPGIRAGRAAGMRTIGVVNTVRESALRDAGADVVTRSLADWTLDAVHHVFNKR